MTVAARAMVVAMGVARAAYHTKWVCYEQTGRVLSG